MQHIGIHIFHRIDGGEIVGGQTRADAADRVQSLAEGVRDMTEQAVADVAPVLVIDDLKIIDIHAADDKAARLF